MKILIQLALISLLSSCAILNNDKILDNVITLGSKAVVAKYPQYAEQIELIAQVIRQNKGFSDEKVKDIVSDAIGKEIKNPDLRSDLATLVEKVVDGKTGVEQEQSLVDLSDQLESESIIIRIP